MSGCRYLVILVVVPAFALPAPAGLFDRRPPVDPARRVPELLGVIRTEKNDSKRAAAAEELRQFDPKVFPEIIPVLIDVAQNDASASVRLEALHSLGKFRPVSQVVGEVLENAVARDKSLRVRLQIRTTLMSYHMSGYHAAKPVVVPAKAPSGPKTSEPPLAVTAPPAPAIKVTTVGAPPSPVAPPAPMAPTLAGTAPPLSAEPPVVTTMPPLVAPMPQTPTAAEEGPDLTPPPW